MRILLDVGIFIGEPQAEVSRAKERSNGKIRCFDMAAKLV